MAEAKTDSTKSEGSKATRSAGTTKTSRPATQDPAVMNAPTTATGADNPLTPVDGEQRPEEYGANEETFASASYRHTHGVPAAEQRHELADY